MNLLLHQINNVINVLTTVFAARLKACAASQKLPESETTNWVSSHHFPKQKLPSNQNLAKAARCQ